MAIAMEKHICHRVFLPALENGLDAHLLIELLVLGTHAAGGGVQHDIHFPDQLFKCARDRNVLGGKRGGICSVYQIEIILDAVDSNKDGIYGVRADEPFRMSFSELAQKAKAAGIEVYEKFFYEAPETHPYHACSDNFDNKMVENRLHFSYCFCAQVVVVEVDELTGQVKVLRVYAANDVGRAVNPALVEGQIEGGVAMGIGMALQENFVQKDGVVITKDLASLHVPKFTDIPLDIQPIMVEEGHPYGPFGAKGMGELPLNATAPAILNAVYNAVGVRINRLPISRENLAAEIRKKQETV
jgi:hypothetical protein